jgi:hypothetical protein
MDDHHHVGTHIEQIPWDHVCERPRPAVRGPRPDLAGMSFLSTTSHPFANSCARRLLNRRARFLAEGGTMRACTLPPRLNRSLLRREQSFWS